MSSVSTFGTFTAARLGMYAAMKGLDVTGHNIANINTTGYTRQMLDQSSLKLNGFDRYYSTTDARVGIGVLCTGVSQLRDPYLDIRFRNEQSSAGAMDARMAALEDLSAIFDEVSKNEGDGVIEKQITDLIQQLQNLSTNVGQKEFDALVRSSASTLATLFNNAASSLESLHRDYVSSYEQDIDTVNGLLENIRNLNDTIRKSEIHGDSALELRDQRNMLLDELSTYMKVDITYQTEIIGTNTKVQKLVVKLDDGNQTELINGVYGGRLSIIGGSSDYQLEVSALTDRYGAAKDPTAPASVPLGDKLYGSLAATRQILTSAGEFTLDSAGNPAPTTDRGIPYYQRALDALANRFATAMNEANQPYAVDGDGYYLDSAGSRITDVNGVVINKNIPLDSDGQDALTANGKRLGGVLFSNSNLGDSTTGITAANLSISKSWTDGSVQVQSSAKEGSSENDNILHIIYVLGDQSHEFVPEDTVSGASDVPYFKGSFHKAWAGICATLANDKRTTGIMLQNYAASATALNTNRDSVSGVDLNDEAANMMQYQKSYAAACRLMTTIDEALDKLINGTGVVGR